MLKYNNVDQHDAVFEYLCPQSVPEPIDHKNWTGKATPQTLTVVETLEVHVPCRVLRYTTTGLGKPHLRH
jgi:hypothetical protein